MKQKVDCAVGAIHNMKLPDRLRDDIKPFTCKTLKGKAG